jgi:hypothetical protein
MSLKIANQQVREKPVVKGDIDQPGSPWAGMSGAVIVTNDNLVIGVVRGHSPAEGVGSLTFVPLDAIDGESEVTSRLFWEALGVTGSADLAWLPSTADQTVVRLERVRYLARLGYLNQEAVTRLQVDVVLLEFQGDFE